MARRRDGTPVPGLVRSCPGPQATGFVPCLRVGDWIEAAARLLWITPERIERWTRRPCGCRGRRDWLNERSAELSARLERWIVRTLAPLRRGR
ncbi:MAG: hypothetical protein KJS77_11240 [Planctomycetes bacterium]|nr:hypothetical protein [Planctomycetota bacterium]